MNRLKSLILLSCLTALFLWIGHALGGQSGMMLALGFAAITNLGAYWFSDKIVLRMNGAQPVAREDAPVLYDVVEDLARQSNTPMPKVYIIPVEAPNAFATGRDPNHAAVAVTAGLLNLLDKRELTGVIAHELSHVRNRDTLIMSIAATLAGALSMIANMAMWGSMMGGGRSNDREEGNNPLIGLVGILLAPVAATLIQLAISRSREYQADQSGAALSADPMALASALIKIETWSRKIPLATGNPATAHLFIINPFSGQGISALFSTHPPTAERVKRLEAIAGHQGV